MIARRLKEARESAGLTQDELAKLTKVDTANHRSRISNYESGRFAPSIAWVQKIADLLDYPTGYFYTENDDFANLILNLHRKTDKTEINNEKQMKKAVNEISSLIKAISNYLSKS